MNIASSSQGPRHVATAVEYPKLTKTNAASIRLLLRAYDDYTRKMNERARQVVGEDVITTKAGKPVQMKYWVNAEWIESFIELEFMPHVSSYNALSDNK